MKIFTFSDWRVQSLSLVKDAIDKEMPDVILYAGDDLERFIIYQERIYVKTCNTFIEFDPANMQEFLDNEEVERNPLFEELFSNLKINDAHWFQDLSIPFYYVNGNDDLVIEKDGILFFRRQSLFRKNDESYQIYENLEGKIDIISSSEYRELVKNKDYLHKVASDQGLSIDLSRFDDVLIALEKVAILESDEFLSDEEDDVFSLDVELDPDFFDIREEWQRLIDDFSEFNGIYTKFSPVQNIQKISINDESIMLFGSNCTFGVHSQIRNPPDTSADIYLFHVPPLGICDLSARFGLDHIGSKELLQSIEQFNPRLVICGHSHMWGGNKGKINDTIVLNVSSHDNFRNRNEGNYAIINTNYWSFEMKIAKEIEKENISLDSFRGQNTIIKKLKNKNKVYLTKQLSHELMFSDNYDESHFLKKIFCYVEPSNYKFFAEAKDLTPEALKDLRPDEREGLKKFISEELLINLEQYHQEVKEAEILLRRFYQKMTYEEAFAFLDRMNDIGIDTQKIKDRIKSQLTGDLEHVASITFDPNMHFFVDVETGLDNQKGPYLSALKFSKSNPSRVWLIGIGNETRIKQFLYPQEKRQFFQYFKENEVKSLVSWTQHDHKALKPIFNANKINIKMIDACQRTSNVLSSGTYRLHELYHSLFPRKKKKKDLIPGAIAGIYADHFLFSKESCPICLPKKEAILSEIKKRNKLDVIQLIEISKALYKKDEFECPNCGFRPKHKKNLKKHIERNACWYYLACQKNQSKGKNDRDDPQTFIKDNDLQGVVSFNEYGVFECKCGKTYLSPNLKYIKNHVNNCPICNPDLKVEFKD